MEQQAVSTEIMNRVRDGVQLRKDGGTTVKKVSDFLARDAKALCVQGIEAATEGSNDPFVRQAALKGQIAYGVTSDGRVLSKQDKEALAKTAEAFGIDCARISEAAWVELIGAELVAIERGKEAAADRRKVEKAEELLKSLGYVISK